MGQDQVSLLLQIISRFFSSKPAFFVKIQRIALLIAAILILLILGNNWFGIYDLGPKGDKLLTALWYVITFLGGSAFTAQLSTTDPAHIDNQTKENVVKSLDQSDIYKIRNT